MKTKNKNKNKNKNENENIQQLNEEQIKHETTL